MLPYFDAASAALEEGEVAIEEEEEEEEETGARVETGAALTST